jgi:hypothetical protein
MKNITKLIKNKNLNFKNYTKYSSKEIIDYEYEYSCHKFSIFSNKKVTNL